MSVVENRLTHRDHGIMQLITQENKSLTRLDLEGNSIANEGAKALADAIKVSWSVKLFIFVPPRAAWLRGVTGP